MTGNWNKILLVDLSTGQVRVKESGEAAYRRFLGGYGLGARVIYSDQRPGTDPLGPDSLLGFTTGVLVGTPIVGATRFTVCAKSPLTGGWGDANAGGYFGTALKMARFDAVFLRGRARTPTVLYIQDGQAQLLDATDLWGRDTFETEMMLKAKLGKEVQVATIGPAGEKLSRIAAIIHDRGRAAARSGLGAVMGSKHLKGVAVRGSSAVPLADSAKVNELGAEFVRAINADKSVAFFRKYGTVNHVASSAYSGDSPIKNWTGVGLEDFPTAGRISDDQVLAYEAHKYTCWHCPIACGGIYRVLGGPYAVDGVQKPEYETCGMFGNNLLNDNMESIIKANYICNAYGLDTISTAASVAFAIECYQNGLISREDTGGLTLEWGDHAAIIGLTEKIARREDIGDLLAEGTKRAAERLGGAAPQYAMHVGGQELVAHDPRYAPTFAVNYETDATPGRHTQFGLALIEMGVRLKGLDVPDLDKYEIAGKGELNARLLNLMQAVFSMGMCSFVFQKLDVRIWPEVINAVTGWNYTFEELLNTGARIGALRQSFNVREGLPVTEFRLPGRATGHPPAATGPLAGIAIDVDTQRRETYQARGWDARNGKPLREVLVQLDLADVAADLYERPGDLPPESHARQEAE